MGHTLKLKPTLGRRTKINTAVLGKLRESFLLGCTDVEACLYADIHPDTLYAYQKKNPKFSELKEHYKNYPVLLARRCVVNDLKANSTLALKFLERKKSNEFSLKSVITSEDEVHAVIKGFNYIIPKNPEEEEAED